jgi:uncharacterized protein YcfJ
MVNSTKGAAMNSKQIAGLAMVGALVATPALANHENSYNSGYDGGYQGEQYEYAQVISAEPLVRQVRVTVPRRECYSETHYVPVNDGRYGGRYGRGNGYDVRQSTAGSMIVGGLIGAAIGHQIGNQQSRRTGAIAGAIIGSAIGNEAAQRRGSYGSRYANDYGQDELRAVEGQRCETRNEEHVEERIDGYRVTYRYNDRTYTTQTARDPGSQIRVRVSVSPLG